MPTAISAIGIASPPYQCTQDETATRVAKGFHLTEAEAKILHKVYRASGIEFRHSVLADYQREPGAFEFFPNQPDSPFPSTALRMQVYKTHALGLALDAIKNCLAQNISVDKKQITHLITVSCTGMYAPGLDIEIVQSLGLETSTQRTCVNFMGCYGAFNGMKVAHAICQAEPHACVLVVSVELCSLHIQKEFTMNNIIANALFADGAAAVLVQNVDEGGRCLRFDSFYCDLVAETHQEMAWDIGDSGFEMILTAYVSEAIGSGIDYFVKQLLGRHRNIQEIDYYAIHPGGIKILRACEAALNITETDNRFSYDVLRKYGNMSSATILFVLNRIWKQLTVQDQEKTIFACAFGPGLTIESMLLKIDA